MLAHPAEFAPPACQCGCSPGGGLADGHAGDVGQSLPWCASACPVIGSNPRPRC
jgi:hypothetical protein